MNNTIILTISNTLINTLTFINEERRNRQDLIEVFKMLKVFSSVSLHELFMMDENIMGTRGHSCRLLKTRCTRDIVKYFFCNKVISR